MRGFLDPPFPECRMSLAKRGLAPPGAARASQAPGKFCSRRGSHLGSARRCPRAWHTQQAPCCCSPVRPGQLSAELPLTSRGNESPGRSQPQEQAQPRCPQPPGAVPQMLPFLHSHLPSGPGRRLPEPQLQQGEEEAEAAPGSWWHSRPQHRPSCPCSRAVLPCPGHHPQRHGCVGEPRLESCRQKKGSRAEAGIYISLLYNSLLYSGPDVGAGAEARVHANAAQRHSVTGRAAWAVQALTASQGSPGPRAPLGTQVRDTPGWVSAHPKSSVPLRLSV